MPALVVGEGEEDIIPITSNYVHPSRQDTNLVAKDDGMMHLLGGFRRVAKCSLQP